MSKRKVHVMVGIVSSTGLWYADFGICMVSLMSAFMKQAVPGYAKQQISVWQSRASILPQARQQIVEEAIKRECTHVLFVDTDQTFPAWTLHALLSRNLPVVGANIVTKAMPATPTARKYDPMQQGGSVVYTNADSEGVEEVWRLGTGVLLVDLKVFEDLPKPWFNMEYREGQYVGEDWYLMERLQAKGVSPYVDHDVSKHVGHIGNFEYTHGLVWAEALAEEVSDHMRENVQSPSHFHEEEV